MQAYIETVEEFRMAVLGDTHEQRAVAIRAHQNADDPVYFELWLANGDRPFGRIDSDILAELDWVASNKGGEAIYGTQQIGGLKQRYFSFTWS